MSDSPVSAIPTIPMSAKEIAFIKVLRGRPQQEVVVKARNGEILSVDRINTAFQKEGNAMVMVEKKERLFPVPS